MKEKIYLAKRDLAELSVVKCADCENVHFRHAGNVLTYRTYLRHDNKVVDGSRDEIEMQSNLVFVCIGCGKPWVSISGELVDGTEYIDVKKFDAVNEALKLETKTDPHC